jgi:hypothetical protein
LSGSVLLAYSGDLVAADESYLLVTWPASVNIYNTSALLATAYDDGMSNRLARRVDDLAAGTYSIRCKTVTDEGQTSAFGSAMAVTLAPVPPAPTDPVYVSGNYTNTRIRFSGATPVWVAETVVQKRAWCVPSTGPAGYAYECTTAGTTAADDPEGSNEPTWPTTLGQTVTDGTVVWTCRSAVTYRVYDSALDLPTDLLNTDSHRKTAAASGSTVTVDLDSLGSAEAGTRRLQIYSICGVQDPVGITLLVEYAASGAVIAPAPNVIECSVKAISGRAITLRYTYDADDQAVAPATVKLWLRAEGAAAIDFSVDAPDVSQAIAAADPDGLRRGTITVAAPADGFYTWIVRVADAAGNLSENTALSEELWAGTATIPATTPEVYFAG